LLAMSMSIRMSVSSLFQFRSVRWNPHDPFMVMQVSQSTPGKPVAGISCSGVP